MQQRQPFTPVLALITCLSLVFAACGSTESASEPDPASAPAEEAESSSSSTSDNVETEPADAEDEPTAQDVEPDAPTDPDESDDDEQTATDDDESLEVDVDWSNRGNIIPVLTSAGDIVDRVDGDTAAGDEMIYSFDIGAGQSFLVRQLGNCQIAGAKLLSGDVDGPRGAGGALFFRAGEGDDDCFDITRYDAEEAGPVEVSINPPDDGASGTFSFEIVDVTNEAVVQLALGDTVASGQPISGAGNLEFAGSADVYRFDVTPGQPFLIRQTECDLADTNVITIKLDGAASGTMFVRPETCDDTKRYVADDDESIVYLTVSDGSDNVATGTYGFELVDLSDGGPITLKVGDIVEPDSPAPGAGELSVPGEVDRYQIEVVEGQTIVLTQIGGCVFADGNLLSGDISGAGTGGALFIRGQEADGEVDCFDVTRLTATEDGVISIEIDDVNNETTGIYRFEVGQGAETEEEADEVLEELEAVEVDEEQLITLDETVLFDFGSAELKPAAVQALADVVDVLGVYTAGDVRVTGHTDSIGSDAANEQLSLQRAESIVNALVDLGVERERLTAIGAGESVPVEPNELANGDDNPDGRAANRRVEIRFSTTG